jgi:hypothetical protein
MPACFLGLLDLWGSFPPMPVPSRDPQRQPSQTNPSGSYANIAEHIEIGHTGDGMEMGVYKPDKFYPEKMLPDLDKLMRDSGGQGLFEMFKAGAITPPMMADLVRQLRNSEAEIRGALTIEIQKQELRTLLDRLEEANDASGISKAVTDFVRKKSSNGKARVEEIKKILETFNVRKSETDGKRKPQLVLQLFKVAGLGVAKSTARELTFRLAEQSDNLVRSIATPPHSTVVATESRELQTQEVVGSDESRAHSDALEQLEREEDPGCDDGANITSDVVKEQAMQVVSSDTLTFPISFLSEISEIDVEAPIELFDETDHITNLSHGQAFETVC